MVRSILVAAGVFLAACTEAKMTTDVVVGFARPGLEIVRIAVLPVGSDGAARPHGPAVAALSESEFANQYPGVEFVRPGESLEAISKHQLASGHDELVDMYELTGVTNRETVKAIGKAIGAQHLLQLHCSYGARIVGTHEESVLGLFDVAKGTERKEFALHGVVWSSEDGRRVWDGTVYVAAQTGPYVTSRDTEDMLLEATRRLIGRLPIRRVPPSGLRELRSGREGS